MIIHRDVKGDNFLMSVLERDRVLHRALLLFFPMDLGLGLTVTLGFM